jgi:hypothetical protein
MATGTGNLPNQNMDFVPLATLPAADLDKLVDNIESLADGTGIGDGAITADKIDWTTIAYFNRTWQTVTRSSGTTYTNSNSYPIDVMIILSRTTKFSVLATFLINGVIRSRITANDSDNGTFYGTINATIPAGATYRLNLSVGTIDLWSELI